MAYEVSVGRRQSDGGSPDPPQWKKALTWLAGLAGLAIAAYVGALATGLGSLTTTAVDKKDLVTSSATPVDDDCGSWFVDAKSVDAAKASSGSKWAALRVGPNVAPASQAIVSVSIQGETERTIRLTRIRFSTKREEPRPGAIFTRGCGDQEVGRLIYADLDQDPPKLTSAVEVPEVSDTQVQNYKPMKFPWDVSLTDGLELRLIVSAEHCFCRWRASIDWASGAKTGTLDVDGRKKPNERGPGYRITPTEGLDVYSPSTTSSVGWEQVNLNLG